jgi:hypothetical protein
MITAMYHGQCEACDEPIKPGQQIQRTFNERRYAHVECPEPAPAVKRPVCSSCFQEVSVSGSCACG